MFMKKTLRRLSLHLRESHVVNVVRCQVTRRDVIVVRVSAAIRLCMEGEPIALRGVTLKMSVLRRVGLAKVEAASKKIKYKLGADTADFFEKYESY